MSQPSWVPGGDSRLAPIELLVARRERLLAAAQAQKIDEVLIAKPEHVEYFTGIQSTDMAYAILSRTSGLVIASDDEDLDCVASQGLETSTYPAYEREHLPDAQIASERALLAILRARRCRRLGSDLVMGLPAEVARGCIFIDLSAEFARVRRPRDPWEVAQLRERVVTVEAGLEAAASTAVAGKTELDVYLACASAIARRVGGPVFVAHTIGSGHRSALPAPIASDRRLIDGDLLLVDLYPMVAGYVADLSRTWAVGRPTPVAKVMHDAARAALRSAERDLGPGAATTDIDRAVRSSLRAHGGLDVAMGHHTGHGIGIRAWDEPWIAPGTPGVLEVGDVIAIEPGAYAPGIGGVRIEGNYLITASGFDRLDKYPEELTL